MPGRRKLCQPELNKTPLGMKERKKRILLHSEQMSRSDRLNEGKRALITCNEKMLTVIDDIACRAVGKRRRPAAQHGTLFEEEDGDAGGTQADCCSKTAEPPTDYDDGVAVEECFHSGPRFNQEYFSR